MDDDSLVTEYWIMCKPVTIEKEVEEAKFLFLIQYLHYTKNKDSFVV